jgi:hypothetical protein
MTHNPANCHYCRKHANWLASIVDTDWTDVVADGGVTAAMVIQQEAREQLRRLNRDSDGSGEAVETAQTGSTVGDSAGPKDIAHD